MRALLLIFSAIFTSVIGAPCFADVSLNQKLLCAAKKIEAGQVIALPAGYRLILGSLELKTSYGLNAATSLPINVVSALTSGRVPGVEVEYVNFAATKGSLILRGWIYLLTHRMLTSYEPSAVNNCIAPDSQTHAPYVIHIGGSGFYGEQTDGHTNAANVQMTQTFAQALLIGSKIKPKPADEK